MTTKTVVNLNAAVQLEYQHEDQKGYEADNRISNAGNAENDRQNKTGNFYSNGYDKANEKYN